MRIFSLVIALALVAGCQSADAPPASGADAPTTAEASAPEASPAAPKGPAEASGDTLTVMFFGDSLTEGYGLANPDGEAYPALIGDKIEEGGIPARVVNAGNSGETSAGGLRRADWLLSRITPDVFVLALGGNDMLRGTPTEETEKNLRAIFDRVREAAPEATLVLAGLEALPNLGSEYGDAYREVFGSVAEDYDAAFVPFLLEGVAGEASLNQPDGVHPTARGQAIMAETVWGVVGPILDRTG
ncbi:MAG: arylesterase [Bacteroidota bacterium]